MPKAQPKLNLSAPWTTAKQAALKAENDTMIWFVGDVEDARLLAKGHVPEEIAQQADRALETLKLDNNAEEIC